MALISVLTKKLGEHRGKPRLWIEGGCLLKSGFVGGARYLVERVSQGFRLTLNPAGTATVANAMKRGKARPVIDLRHEGLAELGVDLLRVVISPEGQITVQPHPTTQEMADRAGRAEQNARQGTFAAVRVDADLQLLSTNVPAVSATPALLFGFGASAPRADAVHLTTSTTPDHRLYDALALIRTLSPAVVEVVTPAGTALTGLARDARVAIAGALANLGFEGTGWSAVGGGDVQRFRSSSVSDELCERALAAARQLPPPAIDFGGPLASARQAADRRRGGRTLTKLLAGTALAACGLFHGAGVLDSALHEGFSMTGVALQLAAAVELDESYLSASISNNPALWSAPSRQYAIAAPIQQVTLRRGAIEADLLAAGIPCTGASLAGRAKNGLGCAEEHDSAGSLFVDFLNWVTTTQPSGIVVENVPQYAGTASMAVIRDTLVAMGYRLSERVLSGAEFGALEDRKRLCMVAVTGMLAEVEAFCLDAVTPLRQKEASLAAVLEPVALDDSSWRTFDYLAKKEESDIAAGKGFRRQLLTPAATAVGTIGRGYAKCRSTEPFLVHPVNASLSRIFTPVEHARVKTIPERIVADMSATEAHEVLGQSVIYSAFSAVGRGVSDWLVRCAASLTAFARDSVA